MDAGGAEALRWQLEQQANWREAEAVREGRQPPVDPDRDHLVGIQDGMRLYAPRAVRGEVVRLCKRLIDGVWMNGMLTEPGPKPDARTPSPWSVAQPGSTEPLP